LSNFEQRFWENKYTARGFTPGKMFVKNNIGYVPIPKNSSSYIAGLLLRNGWGVINYLEDDMSNIEHIMVLLRDPVPRWVSGMSQYLFSGIVSQGIDPKNIISQWNEVFNALILDNMIFDDHTEKQVYFLNRIPMERCTFFDSTDRPHEYIKQFLAEYGQTLTDELDTNILNFNSSTGSPRIKMVEFLTGLLGRDGRFVKQIFDMYKDDYDLIGKTKYYGI